MTSTVAFPTVSTSTLSKTTATNRSVTSLSRHITAVEVCNFVYGNADIGTSMDAIEQFYEANATSSRSVIADLYNLTRQLHQVDVPGPLAILFTLFRLRRPDFVHGGSDHSVNSRTQRTLFQALRMWTDVEEISESDSFDSHRKTIIEHTLNILFLPGVHSEKFPLSVSASSDSLIQEGPSSIHGTSRLNHPMNPAIRVPGIGLGLPSPLHLQLHIITRLSFNEQGRITHHRDFWDVKDVLGLVPGGSLAQWIMSRLAASGLSLASRLFFVPRADSDKYALSRPQGTRRHEEAGTSDLESGRVGVRSPTSTLTPAAAYRSYVKNALGLHGVPSPGTRGS